MKINLCYSNQVTCENMARVKYCSAVGVQLQFQYWKVWGVC